MIGRIVQGQEACEQGVEVRRDLHAMGVLDVQLVTMLDKEFEDASDV